MAIRSAWEAVLALALVVVTASGCTTTEGRPTTAESSATRATTAVSATATTPRSTPSPSPSDAVAPTPTGPPIGTATMQVSGGNGPVTIRYQINGAAEQTETNVTLPWEKKYPVYDEVSTSVTADGGATELICSIILDGKLAAFESEPRPTCSFAYYG